ncbi:MAG TPA: hypothetical protein VG713_15445, partial [Pirellulales bacterium]|nr:hypothetical protein [Pirellulales bacterium]
MTRIRSAAAACTTCMIAVLSMVATTRAQVEAPSRSTPRVASAPLRERTLPAIPLARPDAPAAAHGESRNASARPLGD